MSQGTERTIIGVVGDDRPVQSHNFEMLSGVEQVVRILKPFKLASRDFHPEDTLVEVRGAPIGGPRLTIIAGPCSVESRSQLLETAQAVKEAGADILRGGAYKPRTSPYAFQGMGEEGLELLAEARELTGLPIITEVMSPETVGVIGKYSDIYQIGAAQHAEFLAAAGGWQNPHAGVPEAQHDGDRAGTPDGGRVYSQRRQPSGDGVRTRHPHLRDHGRATPWTSTLSRC